jgi:hypothetical protein
MNEQYLSYTSDCNECNKKSCTPTLTNKVCTNSGFNYGASSKLQYDQNFIHDDIEQSTAPLMSVLDPNRVKSCSQCLSLFGPRAGHNGWGDSIPIPNSGLTPAQELVDIDSIMSNRNVRADRSKRGMVNDIDVFKFKTYDATLCGKGLDPLSSLLTYPRPLYREMSINRFYDLNINPQVNIYYNGAVNSQLEATDNYDCPYPFSIGNDAAIPTPIKGAARPCKTVCNQNCDVEVYDPRDTKAPFYTGKMPKHTYDESRADLDSNISESESDSDYA